MKELICHKLQHDFKRIKTSAKWVLFSIVSGLLVGGVGTLFYFGMYVVTLTRTKNPWLIFLLPVSGILIVGCYRLLHDEKDTGTNLVLSAIHSDEDLPLRMAPLIFISTLITHLFGGSAGREGTLRKAQKIISLQKAEQTMNRICHLFGIMTLMHLRIGRCNY